jgi:ABC-2 type transport system permease protein
MMKFLRDIRLLFMRNLMVTLRNPVWVFMGLFQPVLYLVLFAPLLNGLHLPGFGQTSSLNIFTPGLLVMTALFGTGFAGFAVIDDLRSGVVERLRVTPASRLALLLGMVLRDVLVLVVQCALLVAVATLMGLRADVLGVVLLLGLLAFLGLMMASLSYAIALILKDEGALAATLNSFILPLMLLSGVMLPLTLAPKLMRTLAQFNPFAHAVDASRALMNGQFGDNAILLGFSLIVVLAGLAAVWASRVFRQATA